MEWLLEKMAESKQDVRICEGTLGRWVQQNHTRCQFHQHFTSSIMDYIFLAKRKLAQKLRVKCLLNYSIGHSFYEHDTGDWTEYPGFGSNYL